MRVSKICSFIFACMEIIISVILKVVIILVACLFFLASVSKMPTCLPSSPLLKRITPTSFSSADAGVLSVTMLEIKAQLKEFSGEQKWLDDAVAAAIGKLKSTAISPASTMEFSPLTTDTSTQFPPATQVSGNVSNTPSSGT